MASQVRKESREDIGKIRTLVPRPYTTQILRISEYQVYQPPTLQWQLRRVWEEVRYRADVWEVTNGEHVEHQQVKFMSFHPVSMLFRVCICNRFENAVISFHQNNL
jgi:hypothetical protein